MKKDYYVKSSLGYYLTFFYDVEADRWDWKWTHKNHRVPMRKDLARMMLAGLHLEPLNRVAGAKLVSVRK